jgi:hypothetical protein
LQVCGGASLELSWGQCPQVSAKMLSISKNSEFQHACLPEKRRNYSGNVLLDSRGGVISLSYTPSDFIYLFISLLTYLFIGSAGI